MTLSNDTRHVRRDVRCGSKANCSTAGAKDEEGVSCMVRELYVEGNTAIGVHRAHMFHAHAFYDVNKIRDVEGARLWESR